MAFAQGSNSKAGTNCLEERDRQRMAVALSATWDWIASILAAHRNRHPNCMIIKSTLLNTWVFFASLREVASILKIVLMVFGTVNWSVDGQG
jgi:hypothetical protein